MTYAPARLLEVRRFVQPLTGLSDVELGISPDEHHVGGYHCGWDQRRQAGDYAWSESSRDWSHTTNAARAFDFGWFDRVIYGRRITLLDFNRWFVAELERGAPDTLDVREFIYTPDRVTVRRWDRLRRRSTGDSSHLGHSHISYFADAEHRDKTSPFRRFFGDDMDQNEPLIAKTNAANRRVGDALGDLSNLRDYLIGAGDAVPGSDAWPRPDSPLARMLAAPPVHLSDADRVAIGDLAAEAVLAELLPTLSVDLIAEKVAEKLAARLAQ